MKTIKTWVIQAGEMEDVCLHVRQKIKDESEARWRRQVAVMGGSSGVTPGGAQGFKLFWVLSNWAQRAIL